MSGRRLLCMLGTFLGATAIPVAPAAAQAQLPAGSYQQTCSITAIDDVRMAGRCRDVDGDRRRTGIEYKYCVGDIYNDDGRLTCAIDYAARDADQAAQGAALQAAAAQSQLANNIYSNRAALRSAAITALGRPFLSEEASEWLRAMKGPAATTGPVTVTFGETMAYLRGELAKPANALMRREVIARGFREVYGRSASPVEQAQWDARLRNGSNFVPLVSTETQRLNATPTGRAAVINHAYQTAMGRFPTASDLQYWQGRRENFRFIVVAARDFLYSANGAADLSATVARAIKRNTGSDPTPTQVSQQMAIWSATRRIYESMR